MSSIVVAKGGDLSAHYYMFIFISFLGIHKPPPTFPDLHGECPLVDLIAAMSCPRLVNHECEFINDRCRRRLGRKFLYIVIK